MQVLKKIFKIIYAIFGIIITVNAICLFFVSNLNLGNFLTLFIGIIILAFVFLPLKIISKIPKWFKGLIIAGICLFITFSSFLVIYGSADKTDFKEDAVIVLGAAVRGETPSLTLKGRLDCAAEYHKKNPEAVIIVSGGKGPQEDITEAEAMEKYLLEKGIAPDKIFKEEKADSTYNNFKYSKEILDEKFGSDYSVAFITNEYHTFRSYLISKEAGLENVSHFHSNTTLSYLPSGTARECIGVFKYLIFKN